MNLKTPPGVENVKVKLASVVVEGGLLHDSRQIQELKANLSNRVVTGAEMFLSARRLEQELTNAGYVLARVLIPEQTIQAGGTLRLVILDGYIERVDVSALPHAVRSHVSQLLDPMVGKRGIKYGSIERKLLLASEIPGTELRTTLMAGSTPGASVMIVEGQNRPVTAQFSGDNTLPEALGGWTSGFGIDANSLTHLGETVYVRANGYPISQGTLAASSNYSLTTFTGANLNVTARAITITADAESRLYGNANPTLTYVVGGGGLVNGDTLSGTLSTLATTTSSVGTYAISQGSLAASSNYGVTYTGNNLSATARPITVTANGQSRLYGSANPTLTYIVGSNGLVNGDTLSGALATTAAVTSSVGTYPISQGTLAASSNYSLTSFTAASVSVTARPITVTADAQSRLYGSANPTLTYTVGSNGLVNGDTLSGALATTAAAASNVGAYPISQGTLAASSNYSLTTFTGSNLSVTARPITVTADSQSRLYGNANPTLTYTVGSNGLVNGDTLSGSLATTGTVTSNVGAYPISQGTLAASSNYSLTTFSGSNLNVTARPITVTADAQSRKYGVANPTLTYTVGSNGLENGDTLSGSLSTTAVTTSSTGTYPISQGTLAASSNYSLTSFNGANLTVIGRSITVTADAQSRLYGSSNPALTYVVGGDGLASGDSLSGLLATTATATSNVGTYPISQGTLTANSNYSLAYTANNLSVTARPITVTADAQSRLYGSANPALTYTVGSNGLVNGDTLSGALATTAAGTSGIGAYPISQGTLGVSSNYSLTNFTGANLSITPRPITLTADAQTRLYGNSNPVLTYLVGGNGLVNGDTLNGALGTTAGPTSNVGTYPISQGTLAASSNYSLTSFTGANLGVTARPITVTADSQNRKYGFANPTLTYAVGGSGLANGDTLSGVLATTATTASSIGTYPISQGTLVASANYNVTNFTGASLNVISRSITVTADAQSRLYGNSNPALTYAIGGDGMASGDSLSGGLATAASFTSSVGTYSISQGSLTANSNYSLAYTANTLNVTPRPITVTADAQNRLYGNTNPTLSYTVGGNGLVNGDTLSGTPATTATISANVGTYPISQGTLTASSNYSLTAFTGANLSVSPRPITVTADDQTRVYGNVNPVLTYIVGSNGLANGDTLSGALATTATTASNVGAYPISQGTLAASSNYALTAFAAANLNITLRPITVTADGQTRVYGNANPNLSYVAGGGGLVNGDTLSGALSTSASAASPVGMYAISQGSLMASSNYGLTYTSANLSVTTRPVTVAADPQSRLYGNANPGLTYTTGGSGLVNGDTLSGSLSTPATGTSNVGLYPISQGTLAASSNYSMNYSAANLSVTARPITVTADAQSRLYGDANSPLTYTVDGNGLVNGDTLSGGLATTAAVASNVGIYPISQGTLAASSNYTVASFTGANLSVTVRPITIAADEQTRLYGNANPSLTYNVGGSGLANGDTLSGALATSASVISNVGAYPIARGTLAATSNYSVASFTGSNLDVTARPITVTADGFTRLYGDVNPALTYAIGGAGLANGDSLSGGLATAATTASNVGSYAISQGTLAASSNYNLVSFSGADLNVTARTITVAADPQSRLYGNANPSLTYTVGGNGLANGDTLGGALTTSATGTSNVGSYPISQGTLAASSNYNLTNFIGADLTVNARPLTVTADGQTRTYGDVNPALTYSLGGSGLINGDTLNGALATGATPASNVGSYSISQGSLTASANYSIGYTGANLTVSARPITIQADAQTRLYGNTNPALSYTIGGSGLANGDTLGGALATTATQSSSTGAYPISQGTLAASANYSATFNGDNLTVTVRPITVTADAQSRLYGNVNPALTYAVGGSGLASGDTLSGALATTAATSSDVGTYPISQGTLAASSNYSMGFAGANLQVTTRPITVAADAQSRLYGDANPFLTYAVSGSGLANGDTLSGSLATAAAPPSNVGNYPITQGSVAASSNYLLTYAGANLAVTPRPITILVDGKARIYADPNPALTYLIGGSGLVNGDTLSGALTTTAGSTSPTGGYPISQGTLAASSNYNISNFVGADLTIAPRVVTVAADSLSRFYGNTNPALTYALGGDSLVNGDTLSGSLSTTAATASNTGNYPITQGTLSPPTNYALSYTGAYLSVTPRPITVTADGRTRVYGDANPALTYTVGGNGLVNGDTLNGALATSASLNSDVGNYTISQGSLATSSNYTLSSFTPGALSVTTRLVIVTADAQSRVYGDANPNFTYTVGGPGLVNGDTLSGVLSTAATATANVGSYAIDQGSLTPSTNYSMTYNPSSLSVTARPITVAADNQTRLYGSANPVLTYDVGGSGLANGDTLNGALSTAPPTANVGSYPIAQGTLSASSNYNLVSFTPASLSVTVRPIMVTADGQTRLYGEANPSLTYTVGGNGLANGETLSGTQATTATGTSNVGSYAISQGTLAASSNYSLTYSGGNLLVAPRPITIAADGQTRTYGDANPSLTYAVGGNGLVNSDTLTGSLTTPAAATSNVGQYAITQGTLAPSPNYVVSTFTPGSLNVTARSLTVTADAQNRVYGDSNPALTYALGGSGLVNGDTVTGTLATSASNTSNTGDYLITQGTLTASTNYNLGYSPANLTVTTRPISITADGQTRIYGDMNPALTYTVAGGGLVNGDSLNGALATAASPASNVGLYAIAQGTLTAPANYSVTGFNPATLSVTTRPITVDANGQSRPYGDTNPSLTYVVGGGGLVNGDTLSGNLATPASPTSNLGTYPIAQGSLTASANYTLSYAPDNLQVTARPIVVTSEAQSRTYGNANPALTYVVGGSGLANGDTLTGGLTTSATVSSNTGSYPIDQGTLAASSNYSLAYVSANLAVTARGLTVAADPKSRIYGDANPFLSYVLGGQGLVNGDLLSGTLATPATVTSNVGSYLISQGNLAASSNYTLAYTSASLDVTPRPITVTVNAQNRVYGSDPPLTYTVGGSGLANGDQLIGSLATNAGAWSGIGTYSITQGNLAPPSSNYTLGGFTGGSLTVNPRPITVAADTQSREYGDANPNLTYLVGGDGLVNGDSLNGALATTASNTSNVGSYLISQGNLSAPPNYSLTNFTGSTLSVTPRPIVLTADNQSRLYGNANPALTYAVGGNGLVNGDTVNGALGTVASATSNIGSYDITQNTLSVSSNYSVSSFTPATLNVAARPLTITADAQNRTYGDANPALTYALGGGGLVNGDTVTGGLATAATVTSNVGSYPIQQGSLAASSNYFVSYNPANLAVTPRPITVTADTQTRSYGDGNPPLSYSVGGRGLANGDTLSGALTSPASGASGAGVYGITLGNLGEDSGNYSIIGFTGAQVQVTSRSITVAANAQNRYYGDTNPALTYIVGGQGLANGDTLSGALATTASTASNAGSYPISQGTLMASSNYTLASFSPNTLQVTPRPIRITADSQTRLYGNANPVLAYVTGGLGLVNGDTLSGGLTTPAALTSGVGNYPISQGSLSASTNYSVAFTPAALAITARPITVAADGQTRSYGDDNPALTYTIGGQGLANGDTLGGGLDTPAMVTSNVGSYPISQGTLVASANYSLAYTAANLAVTPRLITISVNPIARAYGDANPVLTYTVGGKGLSNGDTLTGALSTQADPVANTGAFPITQGTLQASSNYQITGFTPSMLDIVARSITINADSQTRLYGDQNPALTVTVGGSGLANGDKLSGALTTNANPVSNAGTYVITQGSLAAPPNYNVSAFNPSTLTVAPRPIIVTADGKGRLYGVPNPPLTYTVGGSGLANGDVLGGALQTAAAQGSDGGIYPITQGTLAASSNYSLLFAPSVLAIFGNGPTESGSGASTIANGGNGNGGLNTGGSLSPLLPPPSVTSSLLNNAGSGVHGGGSDLAVKGPTASDVAQTNPTGPGLVTAIPGATGNSGGDANSSNDGANGKPDFVQRAEHFKELACFHYRAVSTCSR